MIPIGLLWVMYMGCMYVNEEKRSKMIDLEFKSDYLPKELRDDEIEDGCKGFRLMSKF